MKRNIVERKSNLFFSSDLHFGHNNIIKFCDRPYENIEQMEKSLISNWNNKISDKDVVYVLGDIGFTNDNKIIDIFDKLNGEKILIIGNHDTQYNITTLNKIFKEVYEQLYISVLGGNGIFMNHYPMISWNKSHHGTWQLFGHVHSNKTENFNEFRNKLSPNQYDVGVDNNNFTPISYYELEEIIIKQNLIK